MSFLSHAAHLREHSSSRIVEDVVKVDLQTLTLFVVEAADLLSRDAWQNTRKPSWRKGKRV